MNLKFVDGVLIVFVQCIDIFLLLNCDDIELENFILYFDVFCLLFLIKIRMKRWYIKRFICFINMFLIVNFGLDVVFG